ncbi:MAG: hypothetical protein AB7T49_06180 [Oligoflexales bacterium]
MIRNRFCFLYVLLVLTACEQSQHNDGSRRGNPNPVGTPTTTTPNGQNQTTQPQQQGATQNMDVDSEHGIGWFFGRGKVTTIKQSRDEADDDRWSENVDGCEIGFEATMIAKSIGIADDGHFAMKQGGSNHSGGGADKERWLDTGVRSDGEIQLQWEGPHPKNHDFELPAGKMFLKETGKALEGNWLGLKWAQVKLAGKDGSPANGGVRWMMWINTDVDQSNGKPDNSKWRQVYDFIDGKDVEVIQPQTFVMTGTMDVEVRRSGTKSHEVYGGGLHVRPLK